MTWNYRVIHEKIILGDYEEDVYTIHEVYYDEEGNPELTTESACYPQGETLDELREDMEFYRRALSKPVLEMSFFDGKAQEFLKKHGIEE